MTLSQTLLDFSFPDSLYSVVFTQLTLLPLLSLDEGYSSSEDEVDLPPTPRLLETVLGQAPVALHFRSVSVY